MTGETQPDQVPVFVPTIDEGTLRAVAEAFDVGWLGMGAATRSFEEAIARVLGCPPERVVATNTGTSALHIAVVLAGCGPGDEVIMPSFTFVADHQAVLATGATPVLCDIREDDLGLDPDRVAALITDQTKAIMPLHYAGIPCALEEIRSLAAEHQLRVIEDAAHAFGTELAGVPIGGDGDLVCFSFDPVKVITSIDGGAVVVADDEEAKRAQRLRLLGIDRDTELRYRNQRAWDYDVTEIGYRYHLNTISAAIGLSQIARLEEFLDARQRWCRMYNDLLADVRSISLPRTDFTDVSPFIYAIRVHDGQRETVQAALAERGIATGIHFVPAHRLTLLRDAPRGDLTVTEQVGDEILTLPLHASMSADTVARVCEVIRTELQG